MKKETNNGRNWEGPKRSAAESFDTASADTRKAGETADTKACDESGDGLEPFLGFRIWRVRDGQLQSHHDGTVWPVNQAVEAKIPMFSMVWVAFATLPIIAVALMWVSGAHVALYGPRSESLDPLSALEMIVVTIVWGLGGLMLVRSLSVGRILKSKLSGDYVVPGKNTPGLYAMYRQGDVFAPAFWSMGPGTVYVRGAVKLWGKTIEHDYGVKGQFGYPGEVADVACFGCSRWIPLESYSDVDGPPFHESVGLECPPTSRTWVRRLFPYRLEMVSNRWKPAGLDKLRAAAPKWFAPSLQ